MLSKSSRLLTLPNPLRGLTGKGQHASLATKPNTTRATLLAPERSSVISEGVVMTGNISAPGIIHVNGTLEGNIQASKIVVGERGRIHGKAHAQSISVSGKMHGEIVCCNLRVLAPGDIEGMTRCSQIELSEGASIEGDIHMSEPPDLPLLPH